MWKDSPRTVRKIVFGTFAVGAVPALAGAMMEVTALTVIGVLLVIVAAVIHFMFYRCPHCGEFLDRSTGAYCPHCGKKME